MILSGKVKRIVENARKAEMQLRADGHKVEAQAVADLIQSRTLSVETNSRLWHDNQRLRAIINSEGAK